MNKRYIALAVLAFALAVPGMVAAGNVNVTNIGSTSLALHLSISSGTTQVSTLNFSTGTLLKFSTPQNATPITLSIPNIASINAQDINATTIPSSGNSPLLSTLVLVIAPDTPSGVYNITVAAASPGLSSADQNVSLRVYNPTNATFAIKNSSSQQRGVVQIVTASSITSGNSPTSGQPAPASNDAVYIIAGVVAVVVVAAIVILALKRRKSATV